MAYYRQCKNRLAVGLEYGQFKVSHCEIRSLTRICDRPQSEYCSVCCDEKELKTIEHLLCNYPALSRLRLKGTSLRV